MIRIGLDADDRMAESDNRLVLVESKVDLVRRDLGRSDQRLNVVVARAAEDGDSNINDRLMLYGLFILFLMLTI